MGFLEMEKMKGEEKVEQITIGRVAFMVTERCNLKCRLCAPMSPHWKNTKDISFDRLKESLKKLFTFTARVEKFSIGGGGEPFLAKNLTEFLELLVQYEDHVEKVDIVTNGTIVPGERLLGALARFQNMLVIVDDYGTGVSRKFEECCNALEDAGIPVERRENNKEQSHYDGWFDMREVLMSPRGIDQTKEIFKSCIFSHDLRCNVVYDGKIYPCSRAVAFHKLEQIPEENNLYVDLFREEKSMEEIRNEMVEHLQADFFPACAFCVGGLRTHQRHVPAEQMK